MSTTGKQEAPFSYQITATNSPTSFAASGLPAGLSLNASTGLISGAPFSSGTSNISLTATNANGTSSTATLSLSVTANSDINLALTGSASASSVNGGNTAAMAIDNNTGSRWESTQGVDPQYIVITLAQVDTIHAVVLDWENAAGENYTIDTSMDGTVWTNAVTVTGNTTSGFLTYGGLGVQAKYVRMYGTVRDSVYGYSLYEFQVWGVAGTAGTPTFASQPASQTATSGQQVTFTANPSGSGPFTYQWLKNGTDIPGATGSTYSISSVSSSDYGNYLVVVTNAQGSTTSNYFTLSQPSSQPVITSTDTPTMPPWALVGMALMLLGLGSRLLPPKADGMS